MMKRTIVCLVLLSLLSCMSLFPAYSRGYYVKELGDLYQSSQDNNKGHEPLINPTWWSRVYAGNKGEIE